MRLLLAGVIGASVLFTVAASARVSWQAVARDVGAQSARASSGLVVSGVSVRRVGSRIAGTATVVNPRSVSVRPTTGVVGLRRHAGGLVLGALTFSVPSLGPRGSTTVRFRTERLGELGVRSGSYGVLVCADVFSQVRRFEQRVACSSGGRFAISTNVPRPSGQAPRTRIRSGLANVTASSTAAFRFVSSISSSTFECSLDGGPWLACASPRRYASLVDGRHRFAARAVGPSGRRDPTPAQVSWTIDTGAPPSSSTPPSQSSPPQGQSVKVRPSNTSLPTISGSPQVGSTLTASPGRWTGDKPLVFSYRWSDGVTGPTDTLASGDQGDEITVAVTATNDAGSVVARSASVGPVAAAPPPPPPSSVFPLRVGASGRYLVTSTGQPFLMVGDSPQSLAVMNSESSASSYLADREAHGFNTVWVNLLCTTYTFCDADGATFDGIPPFTTGDDPGSYDLSMPNMTYFQRVHDIVADAEQDGIEVMLDPAETGGWLPTLETNGAVKDQAYGAFVGSFFKDLPNIIWLSGNDFQDYAEPTADGDVIAVARGIESTDPGALQTSELSFCLTSCIGTTSLDDTTDNWASILKLNGAYTYSPTYADVLKAYNASSSLPVFMEEANYEGEDNGGTDGGTLQNLRLQEWWTMTSGATGQLYGCGCTDRIADGWTAAGIDTPGVTQLGDETSLLKSVGEWYNLVPDQSHALVTAGFGTFASTGSIDSSNYVTAAETPDHTLALAYLPEGGTITVNMARMAGSTTARWYDPTDGRFTAVTGSPFTDSGSRTMTAPASNGAGDADWVLVLQASAA